MVRKRADVPRDEEDAHGWAGCEACRNEEPNIRYAHYLYSAKRLGLDGAVAHVLEDMHNRFPTDDERARSYADDIKYWLAGQMAAFTNLADADTGRPLPWWEGRAQSIAAMHARYQALGKENTSTPHAWHRSEAAQAGQAPLHAIPEGIKAVIDHTVRDPWATGHGLMHEKGVNRPGREQEAAAFCWQMAADDAPNHDAWMAEGAWWAGGARGMIAWSTPMSRGERIA